ncbi:TPA: GNAT family N-acetyltransferase [Vibrio parahaemolyticus]|uniref:GNAT family N-acetyltransferase n=1 Tax=Vibrio parahaemolyticus TaxID=670 RepID=UPI00329A6A6C|nr:GNAT family N-acetyltransferase [Vibrio parahaemolyticus]HCG7989125.1 GNAT family N-acetyltransferase [Vibrio parahaemolyticus]HCG8290543.1 GNAT family N-acetyltransferase [Vibrio parahaemolyticus]HCG8295715.1 GNAT family N-acetyltransferase [Vibrio parahaemolyticus]HCG8300938.1 GNAT family N-acetyltransferase [Vibrio parahaemolyticus]
MAISFKSQRLTVVEITGGFALSEHSYLLERIPQILTSAVVENLPPYFHGIASSEQARIWLERMLLESRLLQVEAENHELIGFLFAYVESDNYAHIGYLLAEEYWGQGLASELLQGFIDEVVKSESWVKLIGGVDQSNTASAKLLKKLGSVEQPVNDGGVVFYEYMIPHPQS